MAKERRLGEDQRDLCQCRSERSVVPALDVMLAGAVRTDRQEEVGAESKEVRVLIDEERLELDEHGAPAKAGSEHVLGAMCHGGIFGEVGVGHAADLGDIVED